MAGSPPKKDRVRSELEADQNFLKKLSSARIRRHQFFGETGLEFQKAGQPCFQSHGPPPFGYFDPETGAAKL